MRVRDVSISSRLLTRDSRTLLHHSDSDMTFTGFIGAVCMFPLRAIIAASVALRIHPNMLTLIGVLINVAAAWALGARPLPAGRRHHDRRQHLRLHRRQGRAHHQHRSREFGAFWDSTLDRFSDLALFLGLIYLYVDAAAAPTT